MKKQKKSVVKSVKGVAESVLKYGVEVATSHDPLGAAIAVGGKTGVGVLLSRFSASQCAGLIGVMVTSITPQVRKSPTNSDFVFVYTFRHQFHY